MFQLVALDPNVKDFVNRTPNSRLKVDEDQGVLVVKLAEEHQQQKLDCGQET
jgi:hypothetical protein